MSAYGSYETQFKDGDVLCESLREMGFSEVLHHKTAQHLEGYHGDKRAQTAEIIVPRRVVGSASNDIGFKRQADGSYAAIISEYDSSRHNAAWMTKLRQTYLEKSELKEARKAGMKFLGKKLDAKTGK